MWRGTVVLFSALLATSLAYVAIAPLEPKPERFENQEGCYMSEFDRLVPLGESVPSIKGCLKYICGAEHVTINGCGLVVVEPPYELVEEKDKPFPDCCPHIKRN